MIKIHVDHISPRITYTFDFIFGARGLTYTLSTDLSEETKLSYSRNSNVSIGSIPMASFMLEDKITDLTPAIVPCREDLECLSFDGITDPIASIFYTLSRYEEFTSKKVDEFGRFPRSESLASDQWLMRAMSDRWAEYVLQIAGVTIHEPMELLKLIPTFDIDNTFAYRLKSGRRKQLSILKDVLRFDRKRLKERKAILTGRATDPYDTFDKIKRVALLFPETKVFWLIGKWGKKDRNISIHHGEHRKFIRSMAESGINIGLHPSFGSFGKDEVLAQEKRELEEVCGKTISHSRQHFLRFQVDKTYRSLLKVGFTDEYSMGFAEHVGFRSGTARSHFWFDLNKNETTTLRIHPFVYMDGTLREYMRLSIPESKSRIQELFDEVSRYGGDFCFIWHNETIGDYANWNGWSEVLDFTLSLGNESN